MYMHRCRDYQTKPHRCTDTQGSAFAYTLGISMRVVLFREALFFFSPINENYLCTTSVMLWIFRECWSPIFIIDYNSKYGTISIYKRQKQSFRFTSCPREVALSQSESQEAICNNFLPSCLDVWIEETGSRFTSSDVWPQMSHKMDL